MALQIRDALQTACAEFCRVCQVLPPVPSSAACAELCRVCRALPRVPSSVACAKFCRLCRALACGELYSLRRALNPLSSLQQMGQMGVLLPLDFSVVRK